MAIKPTLTAVYLGQLCVNTSGADIPSGITYSSRLILHLCCPNLCLSGPPFLPLPSRPLAETPDSSVFWCFQLPHFHPQPFHTHLFSSRLHCTSPCHHTSSCYCPSCLFWMLIFEMSENQFQSPALSLQAPVLLFSVLLCVTTPSSASPWASCHSRKHLCIYRACLCWLDYSDGQCTGKSSNQEPKIYMLEPPLTQSLYLPRGLREGQGQLNFYRASQLFIGAYLHSDFREQ